MKLLLLVLGFWTSLLLARNPSDKTSVSVRPVRAFSAQELDAYAQEQALKDAPAHLKLSRAERDHKAHEERGLGPATGWCGHDRRPAVAKEQGQRKRQTTTTCTTYTQCDRDDYIRGYAAVGHPDLVIRTNVYVPVSSGGARRTDAADSSAQLTVMNNAFAASGMSFDMAEIEVTSDLLYYTLAIDATCDVSMIGDGQCDSDCSFVHTGYDGGDCQTLSVTGCPSSSDGTCNTNCNFRSTNWDHGDCCSSASASAQTCRDPNSPYRIWRGLGDYNSLVHSLSSGTPSAQMNIFLLNWIDPTLTTLGITTLPFDSSALGDSGGVDLYDAVSWGFQAGGYEGDTAVHEIGHAMNLFHTFQGVSGGWSTKAQACADACYEATATNYVGDYCADTNPTPLTYACCDPTCSGSCAPDNSYTGVCTDCSNQAWTNTPYRNFMAYGDDACIDNFTPFQNARMRCSVDLLTPSWIGTPNPPPSTIILAPALLEQGSSLLVLWDAPLRAGVCSSGYTLERTPAFSSGATVTTTVETYTDTDVVSGSSYSYRVRSTCNPNYSPATCNWVLGAASQTSCTTVSITCQSNVLGDPGFEYQGASWTATDSAVLCGSFCSTTSLARTGTGYIWVGGIASADSQTISQTVTLIPGDYTLTFWAAYQSTPSGVPTYTVSIGGQTATKTSGSAFSAANEGDYLQQTYDFTSAGGSTTISISASAAGSQSFLMDDICLLWTSCTTTAATCCTCSPTPSPGPSSSCADDSDCAENEFCNVETNVCQTNPALRLSLF